MQRIVDLLSIPGCAYVGCKAAITLWPIDHFLAVLTAGAFFILFCDFILDALKAPEGKH